MRRFPSKVKELHEISYRSAGSAFLRAIFISLERQRPVASSYTDGESSDLARCLCVPLCSFTKGYWMLPKFKLHHILCKNSVTYFI